ncbi:MAG: tetratricopeptide repeat protein [Candidatus Thorarchaeota archaeon]|nr:tetratricopeptide repeat protein [Candidatus Thorarchaeota archaeon]
MSLESDALAAVEKYLQSNPSDAAAWNVKGVLLAKMEDFGGALRALDTALRLNPELAEAHTNRGRVLLALGPEKAKEAIQSFERALQLAPGDTEALRDKAAALRLLGRSKEELDIIESLVEKMPSEPSLWIRRGDLELELGLLEDGVRSYDRALELRAELVPALVHRALALGLLERWKEAIKSAESATELAPDNMEAWRVLADVNIRAERYKHAMRALERAAKLDPTDASVENTMGMVAYKSGALQSAVEHFTRAIVRDKKHVSAHRNLGLLYMELEQWAEAEETLFRLTRFYRDDPDVWDAHATACARLEDFCAATESWENARRLYRKKDNEREAERVQNLGRAARINCSRQKKAYRAQREHEKATRTFYDRFELRKKKQRE